MPFDALPDRSNHDSELLLKAKNAILRRGWVQGQYTHAGRLCAVAALAIACDNQRFGHPSKTQRRLARLLARELPHRVLFCWLTGYMRVKTYNDGPHVRRDDVLAMYDRAILRQDQKAWKLLTHEAQRR